MKPCPFGKCDGTGFIITDKDGNELEEALVCECRAERSKKISFDHKLISAKIHRKGIFTFEELIEKPKVAVNPKDYSENKKTIEALQKNLTVPEVLFDNTDVIWIWGKINSGRTTLAKTTAVQLLKSDYKVRWISFGEFARNLKDFNNVNDYFDQLINFDIYVIDNVFTNDYTMQEMTEYVMSKLYGFISMELDKDKKFIITSSASISGKGSTSNIVKLGKEYGKDFTGFYNLFVRSYKEVPLVGTLEALLLKKNKV